MVRSPSPSSPVTTGADSASAGCVKPLSSPGTRPWVAKASDLEAGEVVVFTPSLSRPFRERVPSRGQPEGERDRLQFVGGIRQPRQQTDLGAINALELRAKLRRFNGAPRVTLMRASRHPRRLLRLFGLCGVSASFCSAVEIGITERHQFAAAGLARRQVAQACAARPKTAPRYRVGPRQPLHRAIAGEQRIVVFFDSLGAIGNSDSGSMPSAPLVTTIRFSAGFQPLRPASAAASKAHSRA